VRRWSGWLSFAAAVLIVSGLYKVFDAVWAFTYDDDAEVSAAVRTVLFERDLAAWGWVWLVSGAVLIAAGLAVVTGAEWARWVGIVAASLTALAAFTWIHHQPVWTIVTVALSVLVVYALVRHGGHHLVDRAGPR
jgi:hypothetical protein